MLTTGADNIVGTSGNDTINAVEAAGPAATWTVGDSIDGGAGTDILNIIQTAAVTSPLSTTVKNVETANVTSGTTGTDLNTSSWTGLTTLNVTAPTAVSVASAATTDVSLTNKSVGNADASVTVNGGKNVTLTLEGTTNDSDAAAEIVIGGTTAPAGTVTVTSKFTGADNDNGPDIEITGGTVVTVTESLGNAVNTTNTHGNVKVTGTSATTAVTVNQDRAAAASATVAGKVNGTVTIADANAASTTAAGTIATVTLNSYGNSTINSGALTTVNLSGTGGTLGITAGALTTPVVNTLALNVNDLAAAAITIDNDYKTLNITGSSKAATIANVTGGGVTTLNVAGDAKVTLTNNTFAALTSVVSTNTAGVTLGTTALGAGVAFTGGAGDDSIILSNNFTKAITMGAGNDTVTVGGTTIGTGGSVAAGDGTDTVVMTSAQAATFDNDATFNTKFTGFEVLRLSDALGAATTLNIAGLNNVTKVILAAGGANATTSIIDNIASGSTVQFDADSTGVVIQETNALFNPADTLNLVFNKTGGVLAAGSITAAGVETINITANDASTASGGSAANINTATLVATSATTVTVSGNNGLNLTNTGNTAITKFDASGVVANGTAGLDTAANLAVTFASANATATATVTITGGAGNDTLTGNAAKDVINGGAGNDLINGGTNTDTITVGSGRDIIEILNNDDDTAGDIVGSGTGTMDSITGFSLVSSAISAVDFSSNANFQGSTAGGANLNLLNLDMWVDDAGAGTGTNLNLAVEANGTGSGQAAGVTYTVTNGILTLSGAGASNVDTLGEWLVEAAAVAATNGDILAFQFGSDTYVYAQNGTADLLVQLVGVTGATSLVEVSNSTTASAGAILFADL
ncbi:MAG: beta strand repeat-containing protein [Pseudomonadota bacterium]